MSESASSHVQQIESAWRKLVDDHIKRVETTAADLNRLEALGLAGAQTAMDEAAKIGRESFIYFGQFSAEWRKLTLETTRRVLELLAPRA